MPENKCAVLHCLRISVQIHTVLHHVTAAVCTYVEFGEL